MGLEEGGERARARASTRACELEFEQTYHELKVWLNQFSDLVVD